MNEFFVLSIDCSENDDCEGETLVTTPNPKLLLFLMFLTYDWCTFTFEAEPSDNLQNTAVSDEKC